MMDTVVEELDVVVVGAGICGLATALALHRKGMKSVVLEKSEKLRVNGASITILANGWRALHQLRVDSALRSTALLIERTVDVSVENGIERESLVSAGEARCLWRSDLVEALFTALPLGTIRFGCQVMSIHVEKPSSTSVLQLHDGSLIKAKVLIGCDGANSVVANFIGLKPTRPSSVASIRGVTYYRDGHGYNPEVMKLHKDKHLLGRTPIDENSVYWYTTVHGLQRDAEVSKDPASIREMAVDITSVFPEEIVEMVRNSNLSSISLTRLRFRAPWGLLFGSFRKEGVTVAGDAWHVMGPYLGQGGSAALEDAVVLARCLSNKMCNADLHTSRMCLSEKEAREGLDEYLKERRLRVLLLSTKTYLVGLLTVGNPSLLLRIPLIVLVLVLFWDPVNHTRYDCGEL